MALATRSIYESHYRMQRPSQGNGGLVFRGKDVQGMENNKFRVGLATLGSWETCVSFPLCHLTHLITSFICSWIRQERTLVRRAFAIIVNDN